MLRSGSVPKSPSCTLDQRRHQQLFRPARGRTMQHILDQNYKNLVFTLCHIHTKLQIHFICLFLRCIPTLLEHTRLKKKNDIIILLLLKTIIAVEWTVMGVQKLFVHCCMFSGFFFLDMKSTRCCTLACFLASIHYKPPTQLHPDPSTSPPLPFPTLQMFPTGGV